MAERTSRSGASPSRETDTRRTQGEVRRTSTREAETKAGAAELEVPVRRERPERGGLPSLWRQPLFPTFLDQPSLLTSGFLANPFELVRRMSTEIGPRFGQLGGTQLVWQPQIDVFERDNALVVRADIPGVNKDDLNVTVENNVLTISGERRQETEEEREGYYRSERSYGSFFRAVALPDGTKADQINARFDNGVLEVTIPTTKPERKRGRKIEIR